MIGLSHFQWPPHLGQRRDFRLKQKISNSMSLLDRGVRHQLETPAKSIDTWTQNHGKEINLSGFSQSDIEIPA